MYIIFVLSSLTYALKGQSELARINIRSDLTKQAEIKKVKGCGYGLKVAKINADEAEKVLAAAGIRLLGKVEVAK